MKTAVSSGRLRFTSSDAPRNDARRRDEQPEHAEDGDQHFAVCEGDGNGEGGTYRRRGRTQAQPVLFQHCPRNFEAHSSGELLRDLTS